MTPFLHLEVTWNTSYNFLTISSGSVAIQNVSCDVLFCRGNETSMSCEVGVFDLDKPWEWFTVTTRQAIVTNLQWNKTGTRLLITDSTGLCQVWQMQVGKTAVLKKYSSPNSFYTYSLRSFLKLVFILISIFLLKKKYVYKMECRLNIIILFLVIMQSAQFVSVYFL